MPWCAGSEPDLLRLAPGMTSTNLPEKYGVDILWRAQGAFCGIQRKELSDLLASVADERLRQEKNQMRQLAHRWLVVEGVPKFSIEGVMLMDYGKAWTKTAYWNLLRGIMAEGIMLEFTEDLPATVALVPELIAWTKKPHSSLLKRPGPQTVWGQADDRDFQIHLLQGVPGIGAELAGRIIDHIGFPFGWRVTKEELLSVPGMGKKKVEQAWKALNPLSGA